MPPFLFRTALCASLIACAAPALAQSAPTPPATQVELAADASREVQNDLMTATMFVEANDTDPAKLASLLNRTAADALKTAAGVKAVTARTGGNQTFPVYDRGNKLTGWRGRAEVRLESMDFQAMSALVARLQSTMQLGSVAFAVSPQLKRQTEDALITEAVAAFKARADIARQALGAKGYRIRRLALDTSGDFPVPRPMMARTMAAAASADVPPPAFEGGTSRIRVGANGTVDVE